ncbi:MAG TPA: putative porin [Steroidobacteraceae bacterium]|jgi:hypothetical protein
MTILRRTLTAIALALPIATTALGATGTAAEERNLNELRNTVVNLLQGLVQKGVLTKEQAEEMVKAAQDKAAADAVVSQQQQEQRDKEEAGAVRVPYVPEIVKDEIRKEVADQVAPQVADQVIARAKTEAWGIPGALPDWIHRISFSGDMRVRSEGDLFPSGNAQNTYLNFNAVNAAGGVSKAGNNAFLNTSIDRYYLLARLRLGLDALLSSGWSVGARLTTGTLNNPDSTNQVLGQYGGRYTTNIDLAYLKWLGGTSTGRNQLTFWGGKFPNPFLSTDLVWDTDVTFEGAAAGYRFGLSGAHPQRYSLFLTGGAIPVQEVQLATNDKWMYAGQAGFDWQSDGGSRVRFGVAYYDFQHVVGQRNALESNLLDYTAVPYVQKGNTLFDIRNTADQIANLFALAADYHELDALIVGDWRVSTHYRIGFYADYVKNLGYKEDEVSSRVGIQVAPRVKGYQSELSFGSAGMDHSGAWRGFVGYRYLQRDAVLDAFTDQDYHLGGTDARGYVVGADVNFTDRVWLRARYLPFDAIDGAPLSIDVWQLEVNARF